MLFKQCDVLIFVEHKDREYDISCHIAERLNEKYGDSVVIASLIFHSLLSAILFRPSVIVTPSLGFGKGSVSWLFNNIYPHGVGYINMNYEQFIGAWQGSLKKPNHIISKTKQIQFAWGDHFKDYLLENGAAAKNIYITGRPQNQLIIEKYKDKQEHYRNILTTKYKIDTKGTFVFVAFTENFSTFNEDQIQRYVEAGANEKLIYSHKDNVSKTIDIFIDWLNILSKKTQKHHVIIKPHPGVSVDLYSQLVQSTKINPNWVIMTTDDNAYACLAACDYYITNISTLAIEAKLLSKPSYRLAPVGDLEGENIWWCNECQLIQSYDEFENILNESYSNHHAKMKFNHNFEYYMDQGKDGIKESAYKIHLEIAQVKKFRIIAILSIIRSITISPKRLLGSLFRYIIYKMSKRYVNESKIARDHFEIKYYN